MRAPSRSIQHSSTPKLAPGKGTSETSPIDCVSDNSLPRIFPAESPRRILVTESSRPNLYISPDNSLPAARVYLVEHRLCSLHLGSFRSPFFVCHPERSGWLAKRSIREVEGSLPLPQTPQGVSRPFAAPAMKCPALTPPSSSSSAATSSAPECPYPHASPPTRTEAGSAPQYPACC